jgi:hypothetical protein
MNRDSDRHEAGRAAVPAAARGSRTPDLLITNQLLYLLSYSGIRQRIRPIHESGPDLG